MKMKMHIKTGLLAILASVFSQTVSAQSVSSTPYPFSASGTLNVVLANKNGFVIATDSRMSSEGLFVCGDSLQNYCDNSQKLFRMNSRSALAIAGFAVNLQGTPLDLTVAALLRQRFKASRIPQSDGFFEMADRWVSEELLQPLKGVGSLYSTTTDPRKLGLSLILAGFDRSNKPVIHKLYFLASWEPQGPLGVLLPKYRVVPKDPVPLGFTYETSGIPWVAEAILAGIYRSDDPIIRAYYGRDLSGTRDDMSLPEMAKLAHVILRETAKYTRYVGGADQLGVFSVDGSSNFQLPNSLSTDVQNTPRTLFFEDHACTNLQEPPCGRTPASFTSDDLYNAGETFRKYFMAMQFKDIPVALDNNLFVGDSFDGATLLWGGATFFMRRNSFVNCTVVVPQGRKLPLDSELVGKCKVSEKPRVDVERDTVGRLCKS
jgi:hypothetical protein